MSSTRIQVQLCRATPISSFVQCHISSRLYSFLMSTNSFCNLFSFAPNKNYQPGLMSEYYATFYLKKNRHFLINGIKEKYFESFLHRENFLIKPKPGCKKKNCFRLFENSWKVQWRQHNYQS